VHIVMMMMMMFYYILPMRTVSQRTLEAAVDGDMAGGFQDEGASRHERRLLVNLSYRRDQSILLFHPLFLFFRLNNKPVVDSRLRPLSSVQCCPW